jgi:hypothetical protein
MLILRPVFVIEYSRLSFTTAPAEPVIGSPEQLELFAADSEVTLPARCVVAAFADRAPALAGLRELRFEFGLVAGTADHRSPLSRSQSATARGSNRTHVPTRKQGSVPACASR